jgi:hypothetical protein
MSLAFCFVVAALAVWRVTHLLVAEDGPFEAIARLRAALARFTGLFDCFYCLSLWVAVPPAVLLAGSILEGVGLWLALSAGAILLERATGGLREAPAAWREDNEG